MKRIRTFDELFDYENEKYRTACALDLMYMRYGYYIADGIMLLLGADCKTQAELVYIEREDFEQWKDGEKAYVKDHFGLDD